jgi:hypothetical protein
MNAGFDTCLFWSSPSLINTTPADFVDTSGTHRPGGKPGQRKVSIDACFVLRNFLLPSPP